MWGKGYVFLFYYFRRFLSIFVFVKKKKIEKDKKSKFGCVIES